MTNPTGEVALLMATGLLAAAASCVSRTDGNRHPGGGRGGARNVRRSGLDGAVVRVRDKDYHVILERRGKGVYWRTTRDRPAWGPFLDERRALLDATATIEALAAPRRVA